MRIIVAGTRTFDDFSLFKKEMNRLTQKLTKVELVVGTDRYGPDKLAIRWMKVGYSCQIFHPDWNKYGKSAGPRRNQKMVNYATEVGRKAALIAFWDGASPGTKDIIRRARKAGMIVKVIMVLCDKPPERLSEFGVMRTWFEEEEEGSKKRRRR